MYHFMALAASMIDTHGRDSDKQEDTKVQSVTKGEKQKGSIIDVW